jgi:hypothetical protein
MRSNTSNFTLKASYLEVYNEKVYWVILQFNKEHVEYYRIYTMNIEYYFSEGLEDFVNDKIIIIKLWNFQILKFRNLLYSGPRFVGTVFITWIARGPLVDRSRFLCGRSIWCHMWKWRWPYGGTGRRYHDILYKTAAKMAKKPIWNCVRAACYQNISLLASCCTALQQICFALIVTLDQ